MALEKRHRDVTAGETHACLNLVRGAGGEVALLQDTPTHRVKSLRGSRGRGQSSPGLAEGHLAQRVCLGRSGALQAEIAFPWVQPLLFVKAEMNLVMEGRS